MAKTYIVQNPRDIQKGIPILRFTTDPNDITKDKFWYEGDTFERPTAMKAEIVAYWLERGFIAEK